jgi:hypothetical protein
MMNGYTMSGWGWLLANLLVLALVAVLALALLRRPSPPH